MEEVFIQKEQGEKSHAFSCASCGNHMIFSPKRVALFCPYCERVEPLEEKSLEAPEYLYDPESETAEAPLWDEVLSETLVCPACGAEVLSGATQMTLTCPFCGNHYVREPHEAAPVLRPETMQPHKLEREEAEALFQKWAKRRYFAPRAFRLAAHKPDMKGVYLPYFTYDSDLLTAYSGQGGRRRTVTYTVRVNGKTQMRTKTVIDWYPISGEHAILFDDSTACASRAVDRKLLAKVAPFSTKNLYPYNPAYLAGYLAERYTVGLAEGFASIRPEVERRMEAAIRATRGYDTYRMMTYRHTYRKVTFKHILLPVWLSTCRYKDKPYSFYVNGESGKVAGKAPLSILKLLLTVLSSLALFTLIVLLFILLGNGGSGTEVLAAAEETYLLM